MTACDCCEQPPGDAPQFECKTISATASKCGYYNELDGKTYTTKTVASTISGLQVTYLPVEDQTETMTVSGSQTFVYTKSGSPCTEVIVPSGCYTWNYDYSGGASFYVRRCADGSIEYDENPFTSQPENTAIETVTTYSNEVTTESLVDQVIAALPSYGSEWSGSCSAYRNLSENEITLTLRRMKWRLRHAPTGTCYLKVWLQTRFVSEDEEAEDVLTPLTAYEWTGTGSPCLADPDLPPDHEDNEIIGSDNSLDEPEENGTLTIEIVKWSFVPGYEPDISDPENAQPNGFPDPNWAAA